MVELLTMSGATVAGDLDVIDGNSTIQAYATHCFEYNLLDYMIRGTKPRFNLSRNIWSWDEERDRETERERERERELKNEEKERQGTGRGRMCLYDHFQNNLMI